MYRNIAKFLPLIECTVESIHGVEWKYQNTTRAFRIWPLARTTCSTRPIGRPFLTGSSVTVTSSPGLKDCLLQPRLTMSDGLLASTAQCTTLPLSSFTSNLRKQCGLAQNHSVTVPFKASFFVVS